MIKKFCLIGSSFSALPLAEKISKYGHKLYVVGNNKSDPCRNFALNHFYKDILMLLVLYILKSIFF